MLGLYSMDNNCYFYKRLTGRNIYNNTYSILTRSAIKEKTHYVELSIQ